jgi:hypothetical protein
MPAPVTISTEDEVGGFDAALLAGIVQRVGSPGFGRFRGQLRSSGYCARPVRLRGEIRTCDGQRVWSTVGEPDGVLRKACGNRREAVCPQCAERYRQDAYHLIAAGLRGGKGVPASVTAHPFVFVTLTAPSFGAVHTRPLRADGKPALCRPRRDAPTCEHGVRLSCGQVHDEHDSRLGQPLCVDCFDHQAAVLWNNTLGELWRRTTVYLPRHVAAAVGITQKRLRELARISYVKVAEYQARGLVHVHVAIRLDRAMPNYRQGEIRPPDARFTSQLLEQAAHGAIDAVSAPIAEDLAAQVSEQRVRWGHEREVRPIEHPGQLVGYFAKYSTKSTEEAGGLLHPIDEAAVEHVNVTDHVRGYLRAAFTLHHTAQRARHGRRAQREPDARRKRHDPRLARNAHKLGYRGHCLTKSRRWSTTFMALRQAREQHVREQLLACRDAPGDQRRLAELDAQDRVARFEFAGVGHLTAADAFLAVQAAARAREYRQLAREERT